MVQQNTQRFSDKAKPLKVANPLYERYDWAEFTIATGTTDYDVKTQVAALFANTPRAWMALIWHDQDISVKFNSEANPSIGHEAVDSPHEWRDIFDITNMFITNNSGSTVTVKVMLI